MTTLLKKNINTHISLSDAEMESFCDLFQHKTIKKKSFLLRGGEVCKFEGFVVKGLFRVYHIDKNGFEQILYFAMEDWWITDIDKEFAYINLPKIEKLFRVMTQKTHVALQRRMIDNLGKTADQLYLDFIEKYPGLYQSLSNLQIAAYLGISHEFLSKIRRKIAGKK
jgi:CRP-like cAMP-binding protein